MTAGAAPRPALLPPPRQAELGGVVLPASAAADAAEAVEPGHRPEGYRLRVDASGVRISASDRAGLARARATLDQLAGPAGLPEADITDWPELPVRGLMLDVSRDKVPTMGTLRRLVDVMASWKLNHLELYFEHTYAYPGHEEVWRHASPLTPDEVEDLDAYCAARHVELTANQNCLGHMERWLAHDRYRPLAVTPGGWPDHRGRLHHPTTMDPANPATLELTRSLLAELLPRFASRRAHVGLDEPWELPPDRTAEYGAYIAALRRAPELDAHEMLVWGDIVALHPELAPSLPDGVTVCVWGYEADHPFAEQTGVLAASGRPFWVCPGTSSWNSLVGRWTNARDNCVLAARTGRDAGASGYLVTDWGDHGHLQPLPVSLPGLAAGAAASWNTAGVSDGTVAAAVGRALGAGEEVGRALLDLGDAHLAARPRLPNFAATLLHLWYPRSRVGTHDGLEYSDLDRYEEALAGPRRVLEGVGPSPEAGPLGREVALAVDIAGLAVADARGRLAGDGSLRSVALAERSALADRADQLADRHTELWTERNRPGGARDSADRLRHLAACHRRGEASDFVPVWNGPLGDGPVGDGPVGDGPVGDGPVGDGDR